jgi:hypothetical protein
VGNLTTKEGFTLVVFVHALAVKPKLLERFLQQIHVSTEGLELREELLNVEERNSLVISILKRVSGEDGKTKIVREQMLSFIEAHRNDLHYVFQRLFVINYVYARRNSLVHEGETFSFELGALSRILEVYARTMINLFKEY